MKNYSYSKKEMSWAVDRIKPMNNSYLIKVMFYIKRFLFFMIGLLSLFKNKQIIKIIVTETEFYIDYGSERENLIYNITVQNTISEEVGNKLTCLEYLSVFAISWKNYIYYPNKVRRLVLAQQLCEKLLNQGVITGRQFVAYDGANFTQRMITLWCKHKGIKTKRIRRSNCVPDESYFDETHYYSPSSKRQIPETEANVFENRYMIFYEPLFIGNPQGGQLFGFEYTLFFYLCHRKWRGKSLYVRHHPQVPRWKIFFTKVILGKENIVSNKIDIQEIKILLLVSTYSTTIATLDNVKRVLNFKC